MRKTFLFLLILALVPSVPVLAESSAWGENKGTHFVIYYENKSDAELSKVILRNAEDYYQRIGSDIGYARMNRFWTGENRVKIFLFASRESFLTSTGQPAWSSGYADRDSQTFRSKTIVTYRQETGFIDGLLPHEISHLILHDFVPAKERLPIWFDEGLAQIQEKDRPAQAKSIMRNLTARKLNIPMAQFAVLDIRKVSDQRLAELFYAQSLSIVDFLISKFGREAFARLCRELRDGKTFEEALNQAYPQSIKNYQDLENKWLLSFTH